MAAETLVEVWRGAFLESFHQGHAVIIGPDGEIEASWGNPDEIILPRSACKMIQALPLVRSGLDLSTEQMALACASHQGAAIHTDRVGQWLAVGQPRYRRMSAAWSVDASLTRTQRRTRAHRLKTWTRAAERRLSDAPRHRVLVK